MMKYTKAEVEIVTLENVDIITASLDGDVPEDVLEEIKRLFCKNAGQVQRCLKTSQPSYQAYIDWLSKQ